MERLNFIFKVVNVEFSSLPESVTTEESHLMEAGTLLTSRGDDIHKYNTPRSLINSQ